MTTSVKNRQKILEQDDKFKPNTYLLCKLPGLSKEVLGMAGYFVSQCIKVHMTPQLQ